MFKSKLFPKSLLLANLVLVSTPFINNNLAADELPSIFKKVTDLVEAKNYAKALEELSWAEKEIEKLQNEGIKTFFPDQHDGLTGEKLEVSSALGLKNIERVYAGGGSKIAVSLVGGSSSGAGNALGGLAGLGRMAAMMQQGQPGVDQFRVKGLTANLDTSSNLPELSIFLDSGGILKFEGQEKADGARLKQFAEALDLEGLDKYLKG